MPGSNGNGREFEIPLPFREVEGGVNAMTDLIHSSASAPPGFGVMDAEVYAGDEVGRFAEQPETGLCEFAKRQCAF